MLEEIERYLDIPLVKLVPLFRHIAPCDNQLSCPSHYLTHTICKLLTWGQGLFEFFSLFFVCDDKCVQIPTAPYFKFYIVFVLLDFYSYVKQNGQVL